MLHFCVDISWKTANPQCHADEKRGKVLRVGDDIKRMRWEGVWIEAAGLLGACQNTGMCVFVWPEKGDCSCVQTRVCAPSSSALCLPHIIIFSPHLHVLLSFSLKQMINVPPSCVCPQCFVLPCSTKSNLDKGARHHYHHHNYHYHLEVKTQS